MVHLMFLFYRERLAASLTFSTISSVVIALILVNKRKYEDLLKRVEECNDHKHHVAAITTEDIVENVNEAAKRSL
jgi:hypothetical protein